MDDTTAARPVAHDAPRFVTVQCRDCRQWHENLPGQDVCNTCEIAAATCAECGGIGVHFEGCPELLHLDDECHWLAMDSDLQRLDDETSPPPPPARE